MEKVNGINDEPAFPVGSGGRLYHLYFLVENFSGKRFKLTATQEKSEEIISFYEWDIENYQSRDKFGLKKRDSGKYKFQSMTMLIRSLLLKQNK